jgi:hypothetical protein
MFMHLRQHKVSSGNAAVAVVVERRYVPVLAISALLLGLLIIPRLTGVFLIA